MVSLEGKDKTKLYFCFIYLPAVILFLLSGINNLLSYLGTLFFVIIAVASFAILLFIKSDEEYYRNLDPSRLLIAVFVAVLMTAVSLALSSYSNNPAMLNSVNNLSLMPVPSSVSTMFFATLMAGLVFAATGEELFKLVLFSEGRRHWGNGYKTNRLGASFIAYAIYMVVLFFVLQGLKAFSYVNMVLFAILGAVMVFVFLFVSKRQDAVILPGVVVYIGFPVFFWAALHGIQAYDNPVMIIPAFVNGVFLMIYLIKTKCILGVIFAHFMYNSFITIVTYMNGTANIPAGTPLFPILNFSNSSFLYDILILLLLIASFMFFLLPSLSRRRAH